MTEYKLVPVEPTIDMIVAGRDGIEGLIGPGPEDQYCSEALLAYRAMLAAAPSPEWVKISERLPTRKDADEFCRVWAWSDSERKSVQVFYDAVDSAPWIEYWMPKPRAEPPSPPEGE